LWLILIGLVPLAVAVYIVGHLAFRMAIECALIGR
jgi:hypothetical protein